MSIVAAAYLRKSSDEKDKNADVKSIEVQRNLALRFAEKQGWTLDDRYVFADDGISGAEFLARPGLQALLGALKPAAPFKVLVVSEQSRLGRETLDTLLVIREIERAGVSIFSADGRAITMENDTGEIMSFLDSWRDTGERKKTIVRVRNAAFNRHAAGYVTGGKVYGYRNERLPGGGKQPGRRVVNEEQAAIVRRIFAMAAEGLGFVRIAKALNVSLAASPNGRWKASGVREVLKRDLYRGVEIFGKIRRGRVSGKKVREHLPESEWKRREAPELRIVSEDLWNAAHAKMAENASQFLRLHGKIVGQRESHAGKYHHLLSGSSPLR